MVHRQPFLGQPDLDPHIAFQLEGKQVVDQPETLLAIRPIGTTDIREMEVLQLGVVAQELDQLKRGTAFRITSYNVCYTKLLRDHDGATAAVRDNRLREKLAKKPHMAALISTGSPAANLRNNFV